MRGGTFVSGFDDSIKFTCKCSREFKNKSLFRLHLKQIHNEKFNIKNMQATFNCTTVIEY